MTFELTIENVRAAAAEVVAEKGADFVYNPGGNLKCFYAPIESAPDDDPRASTGCIVGEIVKRLGGPIDELAKANVTVANPVVYELLGFSSRSDPAFDYLWDLQQLQDDGDSWGEALRQAEALLREARANEV